MPGEQGGGKGKLVSGVIRAKKDGETIYVRGPKGFVIYPDGDASNVVIYKSDKKQWFYHGNNLEELIEPVVKGLIELGYLDEVALISRSLVDGKEVQNGKEKD